jgi:hypothetical protein
MDVVHKLIDATFHVFGTIYFTCAYGKVSWVNDTCIFLLNRSKSPMYYVGDENVCTKNKIAICSRASRYMAHVLKNAVSLPSLLHSIRTGPQIA